MKTALGYLKVLDLTRILTGPSATQNLAEMGAKSSRSNGRAGATTNVPGTQALLMIVDVERFHALPGPGELEVCTQQTIIDRDVLDDDLNVSVKRGYVSSRGEHRVGVTNIVVNITNWLGGVVGCLIVTSQSRDYTVDEVGAELKRAAELMLYQAPSLEASRRFCGC